VGGTSERSRVDGCRVRARSSSSEPSSNYSHEQSSKSNGTTSSRSDRTRQPSTRDRSDVPPTPQSWSNKSLKTYESSSVGRKESNASTSTTLSSTASSFLDRLRGGGDTSSRTSLEDDYEPLKPRHGQDAYNDENTDDTSSTTGAGYTLWSRLASAAGTLGVDVGKAWVTNVAVRSGEETPPGEESRLTRAMKAYHIEKVRDPSDLPAWLFEEHERRPGGRSRLTNRQNGRQDGRQDDGNEELMAAPRSRGLRDVYDAAPSSSSSGLSGRPTPSRFADEFAVPSKATNRLKAMRDAKRQNSRFDDDPPVTSSSDSDRRDGREGGGISERKPPPRVGLPSGPGGRPRRA